MPATTLIANPVQSEWSPQGAFTEVLMWTRFMATWCSAGY